MYESIDLANIAYTAKSKTDQYTGKINTNSPPAFLLPLPKCAAIIPFQMQTQPPAYDWTSAWLKAEEYEHILTHALTFQQLLGLDLYPARSHPANIYSSPVNGSAYFLKGKSLSLDVCFPVPRRAVYRWKKTGMPKQSRGVSYLVAEATKSDDQERYRMLAVTLATHHLGSFILCHIRKVQDASDFKCPDDSPSLVKKARKESCDGEGNGLYALLEAAKSLQVDGKQQSRCQEVDYVSLFRCSSVSKFPLLSTVVKPAFEVIHR